MQIVTLPIPFSDQSVDNASLQPARHKRMNVEPPHTIYIYVNTFVRDFVASLGLSVDRNANALCTIPFSSDHL